VSFITIHLQPPDASPATTDRLRSPSSTSLTLTSFNDDLMFGLVDPGRSIVVTVVLAAAAIAVIAHAVALWRRHLRPTVILGIGLGSIAANLIDRLATGTVHDWLVIGSTAWNVADLGVLVFVVVYAVQALRNVS
jgi:lipoprotein signal peptidase